MSDTGGSIPGRELIIAADGAPPLGAYSHGWRVGDLVFVTGTGPIDGDGRVVGDTVTEQTHKVLDNIEAVLRAAGLSLSDVVKVTTFLADTSTFPEYDAAYRTRMSSPFPARTTVGVNLGQVPGMLVEIECVAHAGNTVGQDPPR